MFSSYNGFEDELCYSAAWLYAATEEDFYRDRAYEFAGNYPGDRFDWDDKQAGCHVNSSLTFLKVLYKKNLSDYFE